MKQILKGVEIQLLFEKIGSARAYAFKVFYGGLKWIHQFTKIIDFWGIRFVLFKTYINLG